LAETSSYATEHIVHKVKVHDQQEKCHAVHSDLRPLSRYCRKPVLLYNDWIAIFKKVSDLSWLVHAKYSELFFSLEKW